MPPKWLEMEKRTRTGKLKLIKYIIMNTTALIIYSILLLLTGAIVGCFLTFYIIFKNKMQQNESTTKNRRATKK